MSYFPMYVDLQEQPCLVVGGGRVGLRKVEKLCEFGALVTVIAPEFVPELLSIPRTVCIQREFILSDLEGKKLVIAATGDPRLNHEISTACRSRNIPVNAVDQTEDCTFIFPAYLKQGEVVASFSSGGQSPVLTQYLKREVRPLMTKQLGELAQALGAVRERVKAAVPAEPLRKQVYQELLDLGLKTGRRLSEEELAQVIARYESNR